MASSMCQSNVHADESSQALTTAVSMSSMHENDHNTNVEANTRKCDGQQSNVHSARDSISEISLKLDTIDTLPMFDKKCTNNTKVIRPLYKYIKNNKCLLCGFESKAKDPFTIRTHLIVHVTNKVFKCETCDKRFRTEKHLVNHRLIHKDVFPFSCDLCDKKYRNKSCLRNHKEKKHWERRKFICDVCGKIFTTNVSLKEHLRLHTGERPFVCGICKNAFRLKKQLLCHLRRHSAADKTHQIPESGPNNHNSTCLSDIVSSMSKTNVDHTELSSPSVSLSSADSTCFIPLTNSISQSSECENNCNVEGEMCRKIRDVLEGVTDSVENKRSENALRLDTFDTSGESDNRCTVNTKIIRPLYKYIENNKCLLCGFESKSKDLHRIRNHLFVHVTNKEFNCDTCNKKFRSLTHLTKHRLIHKNEFPFPCELCNKKYRSRASLRSHKVKKHGKRRKFKCDVCDKIFANNFDLKGHLRVHTGERPFVCGLCESAFRIKKSLSCHLRRHCAADKIHRFRHCSPKSHDSASSLTVVSST